MNKMLCRCPKGHAVTVSWTVPNMEKMSIAGKFSTSWKCPMCGDEPLTAPGGHYEKDQTTGLFVRKGDCAAKIILIDQPHGLTSAGLG
jgi:hypothetical protein